MTEKLLRIFIPFLLLASLYLVFNRHSRDTFSDYHSIAWGDAAGYYVYLPALFCYDFSARSFPDSIEHRTGHGFRLDTENNKVLTKYTYGTALMQAPFFLAAHWLAKPLGFEKNGYSKIYFWSVMVSGVSYLIVGLQFLKKLLLRKFTASIVMISLLLIYAGTNLYYYAINSGGYSHIYSFALFAAFLYILTVCLEKPSFVLASLLGFVYGLIVIIRPTNAIIGLLFIFFNVSSENEFKHRISFYRAHGKKTLVLVFMFMLVFIPQLLYWKYASGSFFHYSYTGESFEFLFSPKITEVLFSTHNGWITWSPLAVLMLVGILFMIRRGMANGWLYAVLILMAVYLFSSWWNWWFGCSYGARNFVEYYAILAFPLAVLISILLKANKIYRYAFLLFACVCLYLNLNTIYHYDDCWYGGSWDWTEYQKIISK